MDNNAFPVHRSEIGLKYVDMLAEEGFLAKETIRSEDEISEYNKLIDENKPLPDDIYAANIDGKRVFMRVTNAASDMTPEEMRLYVEMKKAREIHTIKCWVVFFGVIAVVTLILGFLGLLS